MADRCIRWERPYASTGQGHRKYRSGGWAAGPHGAQERSAGLAYDPEKNTPSGFDYAYTAAVDERADWGGERMWYRTLWKETGDRDDVMLGPWRAAEDDPLPAKRDLPSPFGHRKGARQERSAYCPPSVATDRSCRRALDRDVAANPPGIPMGESQRWYDKIAPTGPWECTEYDDG